MADNKVQQSRKAERITKLGLSSDCGLKLAHMKLELLVIADQHAAVNNMKLELLVIADQHAAVNTFPGLVHTARHTMRVDNTRSL